MDALDLFLDDLRWMEEHCWILDRTGQLVPLRYNAAQLKLVAACIKQLAAGKPIRVIILKARQLGITTFIVSLFYARSAKRQGFNGLLIAHTSESTKEIWRKVPLLLERSGMGAYARQPFAEVSGPLQWTHSAQFNCITAGGKHIGHGSTLLAVHYSEEARYGEGQSAEQQARIQQMVAGVNAAIAKSPDSMVFKESTANGFNAFHREWDDAVRGRNDFAPVFISWMEEPSYAMPLGVGGLHSQDDLDADELQLREHQAATLEQLAWRRWVIANESGGDVDRFREAYPSTPEEAFLVSGRPVFDRHRLAQYLARARNREPIWQGDIAFDPPCGWKLTRDPHGPLKIWTPPSAADRYAIGADNAECKTDDSDYDAAVVRSRKTRDICATLHLRCEPGVWAQKLAALGWLYEEALLAVENNSIGEAVLGTLRGTLGGPSLYNNLYRYKYHDKARGATTTVYGWHTGEDSKIAAIEAEMALIREGAEDCPSEEILQEASTFVHTATGCRAESGAHDDLVIAWAISSAVIDQVVLPKAEVDTRDRIEELLEKTRKGQATANDWDGL